MQTTLDIFKKRSEIIVRKFDNSKTLIEIIDEVEEFREKEPDKNYHLKNIDGVFCLVTS